jgi:hypothetical protein
MELTPSLIAVIAIALIVVFLLGFRLTRSGRPYSVLILTVHKLAALAVLVILALLVVRAARTAPLDAVVWIASMAGAVFFLAAIISGGLLSTDKTLPPVVKALHRVSPFLAVLAGAAILYLLP